MSGSDLNYLVSGIDQLHELLREIRSETRGMILELKTLLLESAKGKAVRRSKSEQLADVGTSFATHGFEHVRLELEQHKQTSSGFSCPKGTRFASIAPRSLSLPAVSDSESQEVEETLKSHDAMEHSCMKPSRKRRVFFRKGKKAVGQSDFSAVHSAGSSKDPSDYNSFNEFRRTKDNSIINQKLFSPNVSADEEDDIQADAPKDAEPPSADVTWGPAWSLPPTSCSPWIRHTGRFIEVFLGLVGIQRIPFGCKAAALFNCQRLYAFLPFFICLSHFCVEIWQAVTRDIHSGAVEGGPLISNVVVAFAASAVLLALGSMTSNSLFEAKESLYQIAALNGFASSWVENLQ